MAKKITYANKQTLYTDPAIGEEYKVTSGDMNEIKEVVNENLDSAGSKLGMTISADGMLTLDLKNEEGEVLDTKQAKVVTDLSEYAKLEDLSEVEETLNSSIENLESKISQDYATKAYVEEYVNSLDAEESEY